MDIKLEDLLTEEQIIKLNELGRMNAAAPRDAVRKRSQKIMGLSRNHNQHAKRQQSKAARQYDIDTEDYTDGSPDPEEHMGAAPYVVGWSAQSWEWYGDDDPGHGRGRYKPKGDGGKVMAINVPTYEEAQRMANELDNAYNNKTFPDEFVYANSSDGYYLDYHGAWVESMSEYDEDWRFEYDRPKDYRAENK